MILKGLKNFNFKLILYEIQWCCKKFLECGFLTFCLMNLGAGGWVDLQVLLVKLKLEVQESDHSI